MTGLKTLALTLLAAAAMSAAPATRPADTGAKRIAADVVKAAGGAVWPGQVKTLAFTFNVVKDGKTVMSAQHVWDVPAGKDTVTWDGKTVAVDVQASPSSFKDGTDQKAAFARWTNDSYWLLMPLKLLDSGVQFGPVMMTRDMPPSRANMTMSFGAVGMTPGDQYDLSIDLRKNQVTHWVYRPNADTKAGFKWEGYRDFNGLTLATEHPSDDGKLNIKFTGVSVERK